MKLTKAKKNRIASAICRFGRLPCLRAYLLNVGRGEGSTVIEIETGIPDRNQGLAIMAGEAIYKHAQEVSECGAALERRANLPAEVKP